MRLYHIAPISLSIPSVGRYLLRSLFFLRTAEQKEITRARYPFYSAKVSAPTISLSIFPRFLFLTLVPFLFLPRHPLFLSLSLRLCPPGSLLAHFLDLFYVAIWHRWLFDGKKGLSYKREKWKSERKRKKMLIYGSFIFRDTRTNN